MCQTMVVILWRAETGNPVDKVVDSLSEDTLSVLVFLLSLL
jgi:hypothetical protein